jgi:hydroxyacylglutathione hydrolase
MPTGVTGVAGIARMSSETSKADSQSRKKALVDHLTVRQTRQMKRKTVWKFAALVATVLTLLAGLGLAFAPVVYAEIAMVLDRFNASLLSPPATAPRPGIPAGIAVDGYWQVQQIAQDTWAIGEPNNELDNYEYLLVGQSRALLIDAGATTRDIHAVLARLTQLPVTVIPSHLHSDHTNGLRYFSSIAMIDLPETRARVRDGLFHIGRYQYFDTTESPVFRVTEWVKPDGYIDLGGRRVQALWTPGHTTTSVSIHDAAAKLLFSGDYICMTSLYAFMPDSSLSAYKATADRLLAIISADTTIYGAHCCRNDAPPEAPWLDMSDLRDMRQAIENIQTGKARGRGFILRRLPVNARMTIVTLYPFGNQ